MGTTSEMIFGDLSRVDLLIHREILRLRATYQLSLDEFRGLYISDQQVDHLVNEVLASQEIEDTVDQMTQRAEEIRQWTREQRQCEPVWVKLQEEFHLSEFELDVLFLGLTPHINPKYETLFAYLNNDVSKKWLTCDLALRLLSATPSERIEKLDQLTPHAPLLREGLLQILPQTSERSSWLSTGFIVSHGLAAFLLGYGYQAPDLVSLVDIRQPQSCWDDVPIALNDLLQCKRLRESFPNCMPTGSIGPVIVIEGRDTTGAYALAEAWCHEFERPMLVIDAERLRPVLDRLPKLGRQIVLQQRLTGAGVLVYRLEVLVDKEGQMSPEARRLLADLAQYRTLLMLACDSTTSYKDWLREGDVWSLKLSELGIAERQKAWQKHLAGTEIIVPESDLTTISERFLLSEAQIRKAVRATIIAQAIDTDASDSHTTRKLFSSAREQSGHVLASLAVKVTTTQTWDDLVLHPATMKRVRDVTAAIQYRHVVYGRWGFDRLGTGIGLKVLFAGASGTGKTMSAGVIANDLGLDLYKIDLQGVVSKYIGETEKNLERIFRAAYCSNAILFFDEADALFGKRSEIKDAHDRYANIEVSYLLQKMEDFDGVVILASNWRKNIDDAFARRMHYVVDFPLPDEPQRVRLWQGMFPAKLPLASDVDVEFLAKQFTMTGGDIKNVVLDAAFLAAQDGQVVTMKQLIQALTRQHMKQGRIPSVADFKQYFSVAMETETV